MKFRKKPVVIEAIQFNGSLGSANTICSWSGNAISWKWNNASSKGSGLHLRIDTLEGVMKAREGDWIIKGVQGEFYPCKSDIFEASYEAANDE